MKRVVILFYLLVMSQSDLFSQQDDFLSLVGPYLGQKPPGMIPEIVTGKIASTKYDIAGFSFSPNGNEIVFFQ